MRLPAKCYTAEEEYYTADESSSDQTGKTSMDPSGICQTLSFVEII